MLPIRPAAVADAKVLTELRRVMHDTVNGPHPRHWMPACEEMTRHRPQNGPALHARVAQADNTAAASGVRRSRLPGAESPATAAGFVIALELGYEDLSEESVAMNRYAGQSLPVGRYAAPRNLSDHDEAPVSS